MKQLKPGQVCTINKHVYRCKKRKIYACIDCEEANHNDCILAEAENDFNRVCTKVFGNENYPVLIK